MESTRTKRKAVDKNSSDYISQLPDDLLIHILSFLSVTEAVQTCLVAKRWKNLWAQVPILDLESANFNSDDQFIDCVTSVLKHRDTTAQLDTFKLTGDDCFDFKFNPPLFEWISQAVQFSPRSVCIQICAEFEKTLPQCLFTCKSLEELVVVIQNSDYLLDFDTKAIKLPRLKKLHLSYVLIYSNEMHNLLKGCPVLEDLYFEFCYLGFSHVSSNTLKSLVVNNCDLDQEIQFPFLEIYNTESVYLVDSYMDYDNM